MMMMMMIIMWNCPHGYSDRRYRSVVCIRLRLSHSSMKAAERNDMLLDRNARVLRAK